MGEANGEPKSEAEGRRLRNCKLPFLHMAITNRDLHRKNTQTLCSDAQHENRQWEADRSSSSIGSRITDAGEERGAACDGNGWECLVGRGAHHRQGEPCPPVLGDGETGSGENHRQEAHDGRNSHTALRHKPAPCEPRRPGDGEMPWWRQGRKSSRTYVQKGKSHGEKRGMKRRQTRDKKSVSRLCACFSCWQTPRDLPCLMRGRLPSAEMF